MPLSADEVAELARLIPVARSARRQHAPTSPARLASERVTEVLALAHAEGRASIRELALATGISYHSVARRVRLHTGAARLPRAPRAPRAPRTTLEEGSALPPADKDAQR